MLEIREGDRGFYSHIFKIAGLFQWFQMTGSIKIHAYFRRGDAFILVRGFYPKYINSE